MGMVCAKALWSGNVGDIRSIKTNSVKTEIVGSGPMTVMVRHGGPKADLTESSRCGIRVGVGTGIFRQQAASIWR